MIVSSSPNIGETRPPCPIGIDAHASELKIDTSIAQASWNVYTNFGFSAAVSFRVISPLNVVFSCDCIHVGCDGFGAEHCWRYRQPARCGRLQHLHHQDTRRWRRRHRRQT